MYIFKAPLDVRNEPLAHGHDCCSSAHMVLFQPNGYMHASLYLGNSVLWYTQNDGALVRSETVPEVLAPLEVIRLPFFVSDHKGLNPTVVENL